MVAKNVAKIGTKYHNTDTHSGEKCAIIATKKGAYRKPEAILV